jgi:vitamin B12 transporter
MNHNLRPSRVGGVLLTSILACASAGEPALRADDPATQLAPVVVAATRMPEPETTVGSDVGLVTGLDASREQLASLQDALSAIPGAPVFAAGQRGAGASIFMRGANSQQTLILVDGIRMNDANTDYAGFVGGSRIFPSDRIEVAMGPQSTLYGSEAVGGVISISTAKGSGRPSGSVSVETGSYGTRDATATAQGAAGKWAYDAGLSYDRASNDRVNNAFTGENLALRLDYAAGTYVDVGATLRGMVSRYGDPGDMFTNDPVSHETEENWMGTLFADARLTQYVTSRLTLGGQDRHYNALSNATAYTPLATTIAENRRGVLDWQNTIQMTQSNRFLAGLTAEEDTVYNDGYGSIDSRQGSFALYGEDEWNPLSGVYLTGGLRHDDYDSFGSATTGRVTAAVLTAGKSLKLRGSYGTGFNAPSFLDLYGVDTTYGYRGNPRLQPEHSDGWDMGADFYAPDGRTSLGFTWFQTDFRNLIVDNYAVFPSTTENVGKARTRGEELTLQTVLAGIVQAKVSYARLEADDVADRTPLLRRPRYQAAADLWTDLGRGFTLGAGAGWMGARADVDPVSYSTIYDPTYSVARVYAAWRLNAHLSLRVRVENALGRSYQPVAGYPALGRGVYGGATWAF